MANRPSTAAILAAARAADGRRNGANGSNSQVAPKPPTPAETQGVPTPPQAVARLPAVELPVERNGSDAVVPPSVAAILEKVRGQREATTVDARPPSVATILDHVRGSGPRGVVNPPSMATVLEDVRRAAGGTGSRPARPAATPAVHRAPTGVNAAAGRRPATADILAAARKQDGSGPSVPGAPAKASAPSKTAAILAAARRQGAGAATGPAAASPRPKPSPRPIMTGSPSAAVSPPPKESDDAAVRPNSIAKTLAAVRSAAGAGLGDPPADLTLPPLAEMVSALRQLDVGSATRVRNRPTGWVAKLRSWFAEDRETHRGASI